MGERETGTQLAGRLWLEHAGQGFLGHGRVQLLELIDQLGSISAAAKAMKMSYKAAWDAVEGMNNLADRPLVERTSGGRRGGGTVLTPYAKRLLQAFRLLEEGQRRLMRRLGENLEDPEAIYDTLRRFAMRSSARNQLAGTVTRLTPGAVNSEVLLDIGSGEELVAIITNHSAEELGLGPGCEVLALIKASWPIIVRDANVATSARNRLCGTVVACREGAVNGELTLELSSGRHLSVIVTNESIRNLGLRAGVEACALIKASDVILAVNT